ncbi:MAG: hypothetical protein MI892_03035 [Desulfobacterales bacterium]|nr:hypothetical protein [Desulfobacterales bacterium]
MFSKLGIFSLISGFVVGLFSILSQFMGSDNIFVDLTLSSFSEANAEAIVDAISVEFISSALYTLFFDIPLAGILIGAGVMFLVIALFVKEH